MQKYRKIINKKTLKSIARRIGKSLPVEKIILFGSHAYGKVTKDSDVDLFVVMKSKKRPAERAMLISDLLYPRQFPVDIIVRTPQEVKRRLSLGDFFIENIINNGEILYQHRVS